MATPPSAAAVVDAFRRFGVEVVTYPGWENHNRNRVGAWGGVNGVMIHHTVTRGAQSTLNILKKGYSGLPGPLSQFAVLKDAKAYGIGWGRANHAGKGDSDVHRAVVAENYGANPPRCDEADMDGNPHYIGFECENMGDGEDPWPAAQVETMVRMAAAICWLMKWSADSVIAHKEWQPGKVDPRGPGFPSMEEFRRRVQAYIDNPPNTKQYHEVQAGDTFWGISRKYGISVEALVALNPSVSPSLIHPGDKIRVK